jgi:TatD DNase family protein
LTVLVDAHAHLDHYGPSGPEIIRELMERGILTVAVSMDPPSYERTRELCEGVPLTVPAFGVHPWEAPRWSDRLDELDRHTADAPLLGEVGLDFHFVRDEEAYGPQREVFGYFLEAAKRTGKVLNIHTKGAEAEVARLLHDVGGPAAIVHWYSGGTVELHRLLDEGAFFTVGVEVLRSTRIVEIARMIPEDRLLTETDNPGGWRWLEGVPGRPSLVQEVLDRLAEIRGVSRQAMEDTVARNAERVLRRGGIRLDALPPPLDPHAT